VLQHQPIVAGTAEILAFLRHGARSYSAWVTVIDHRGQPNPGPHGCSPTCIVLNANDLTLDHRFDYYMYGQFMKFIRPGAIRVHSNERSGRLANCAFQNSDGSIVLVVVSQKTEPAKVDIESNGWHLTTEISGDSVATYRWLPSAPPSQEP